jgi:hypothetical protein
VGPFEFLDVEGRFIFILLFILLLDSGFIVNPERILEYTGEIFGEYFDDFGVNYFRINGSYNLVLIAFKRLFDIQIFIIFFTK